VSPRRDQLLDGANRQAVASMERTVGIYSGALGYGHKEDLLKMQGLPVPAFWKDLIKPVHKGKVPVANPTCRYVLQHTHKRVPLVSGLGGMFEGQVRSLRPGDVMLVASFLPYTEESLQCARLAEARGARLVAITDSQMSPFAALADVTLVVQESSTFGFRSLSNTLCLARSLFIARTYRTELLSVAPGDGSAFPPVRPV
jgi:hypothetical protein